MIEALERFVDDLAVVNSKLLLLIGAPNSGKSELLRQLAERRELHILNLAGPRPHFDVCVCWAHAAHRW